MIQVYTGNGKGKSTAALGLALRAAGAGKKVYICQFIKKGPFCEHASLKKLNLITCVQFGRGSFVGKPPAAKDILCAGNALQAAAAAIKSKKFAMVILDEVNVALSCKLIKPQELLALIKKTPSSIELVLTGRDAHPEIIKSADLVSQINEVKHYFRKGVKARKGIEF